MCKGLSGEKCIVKNEGQKESFDSPEQVKVIVWTFSRNNHFAEHSKMTTKKFIKCKATKTRKVRKGTTTHEMDSWILDNGKQTYEATDLLDLNLSYLEEHPQEISCSSLAIQYPSCCLLEKRTQFCLKRNMPTQTIGRDWSQPSMILHFPSLSPREVQPCNQFWPTGLKQKSSGGISRELFCFLTQGRYMQPGPSTPLLLSDWNVTVMAGAGTATLQSWGKAQKDCTDTDTDILRWLNQCRNCWLQTSWFVGQKPCV